MDKINGIPERDEDYLLERSIDCRTGGRVHQLCVEESDGRTIIHGLADSYYVVQLAIAALLEALQTTRKGDVGEIELDMRVR